MPTIFSREHVIRLLQTELMFLYNGLHQQIKNDIRVLAEVVENLQEEQRQEPLPSDPMPEEQT
jgi:hypothetical protein